jgi:hypothetical protein
VVSDSKQDDFEQRAQTLLQASADQLDGATRSRLTQARHAALDAIKQRQRTRWFWLMPATGAAAAAIVAVLLVSEPKQVESDATVALVDEMDIVTAEDSLEFYRDVEFYSWLDAVIDDTVIDTVPMPESEA